MGVTEQSCSKKSDIGRALRLRYPRALMSRSQSSESSSQSHRDTSFFDDEYDEYDGDGDGDENDDGDDDVKPSLRLVNFNTFAMNVEYSILMPTVYDYTLSLGGDAPSLARSSQRSPSRACSSSSQSGCGPTGVPSGRSLP